MISFNLMKKRIVIHLPSFVFQSIKLENRMKDEYQKAQEESKSLKTSYFTVQLF